jgi:FkbM family methyltransferase
VAERAEAAAGTGLRCHCGGGAASGRLCSQQQQAAGLAGGAPVDGAARSPLRRPDHLVRMQRVIAPHFARDLAGFFLASQPKQPAAPYLASPGQKRPSSGGLLPYRPAWSNKEGTMPRKIHVFDNGVSVYDDHLIPAQRQRYQKRNVHEAREEDIFAELIRQLPVDGCYLNIGCAIGYYQLLAKRLAPALTIHAVEPLAQHRAFVAENIRLNGFDPTAFTIHEQAVGTTDRQGPVPGARVQQPVAVPPDEKKLTELANAAFTTAKLSAAPEISPVRATHDTQVGDWVFCIRGRNADQTQQYAVLIRNNAISEIRSSVLIDGCYEDTYRPIEITAQRGVSGKTNANPSTQSRSHPQTSVPQ